MFRALCPMIIAKIAILTSILDKSFLRQKFVHVVYNKSWNHIIKCSTRFHSDLMPPQAQLQNTHTRIAFTDHQQKFP